MRKQLPSHLYSGNASFIEDLYERFLQNPKSVEPQWRDYFNELKAEHPALKRDIAHSHIRQTFYEAAKNKPSITHVDTAHDTVMHQKQVFVLQLINAHRFRGHHQADLDPLKQYERPVVPELDPAYHNLTASDMDCTFNTGSLFAANEIPLREILAIVHNTYCRSIGTEYMHINETDQKRWIQQRLEECRQLLILLTRERSKYSSESLQQAPWKNICIPNMLVRNVSHWKVVIA